MKIISVFNNKGGVGKTTLTYHIAQSMCEMGYKVLMIDGDPQCNLTIYSLGQDYIQSLWAEEDDFIDSGFDSAKGKLSAKQFEDIANKPRSLHYILQPTQEGTGEHEVLPPPVTLRENLDIIPGRLTLHLYEEKVASRWNDLYRGEPLAIRTISRIRTLAEEYNKLYDYDYIIIDTSPSLGSLNKVIISTVDGFFIPALPDLFSLYGIKNIGKSLAAWKNEFDIVYQLISSEKRHLFPEKFVRFLGYTIYNARKYEIGTRKWDLAQAHLNYAERIPDTINRYIIRSIRGNIGDAVLAEPIGETSVMYSHNTFPSMAQYYNLPMWLVPDCDRIEAEHANTLRGAKAKYLATKDGYESFTEDLISRIDMLGD
ncbi:MULTISPECIES: ParA family protein [Enterobacterales]|uniref:ParA family protein n=1 Tax=Enterobacter mori TaxID=539813 RepID=UPI0021113B2C|nr:AAA family ATPase [Enterobacter mori]